MINKIFKIVFSIFTIYVLFESIFSCIIEVKNEKNIFGGTCIVLLSLFSIILGNILI